MSNVEWCPICGGTGVPGEPCADVESPPLRGILTSEELAEYQRGDDA